MQFSLSDNDEESSIQKPIRGWWMEASHNGKLITMTCRVITFSTTESIDITSSKFRNYYYLKVKVLFVLLVAARSIIDMILNNIIA